MSERVQLNTRIPAGLKARLDAYARETGEAVADLVTRALEGLLAPASTLLAPPASTVYSHVDTGLLPASSQITSAPVLAAATAALTPEEHEQAAANLERRLAEERARRGVSVTNTRRPNAPLGCSFEGCARAANCRVEGTPYCLEHATDQEYGALSVARFLQWAVLGEEAVPYRPRRPARIALPACEACGSRRYQIAAVEGYAVAARCEACRVPCPNCNGLGVLHVEHEGKGYAYDCYCRDRAHGLRLFNAAKIPGRYAHLLVGPLEAPGDYRRTPSQVAAGEACEAWARAYKPYARGLLLWGASYGTSKTTYLCRALAFVTLVHRVPARFVEWGLLLASIKDSWESESQNPLSTLFTTPVVVLDELGKQPLRGDWQPRVLDDLISARYQAGHPTLYASNKSPANLRQPIERGGIGERLWERLVETCERHEVKGGSIRLVLDEEPEGPHA